MRSIFVAAFAAAVLVGPLGVAQAGETVETVIVHDGQENTSGSNWTFYGHLESGNAECLNNRVVKMYKRRNGEWVFVDKDRTGVEGTYETKGNLPSEPPLKFTVKKKDLGGVVCGGDSIKPFSGPGR